jgi:DNA modification methylase
MTQEKANRRRGKAPKKPGERHDHKSSDTKPNAAPPVAVSDQMRWGGRTKKGVAWEVLQGDALITLRTLQDGRFNCIVTSPPYYSQRDYETEGQIGLEATIDEYVKKVVGVMGECRRVLTSDGLLFLNLGDTYYSAKGQPKGVDRKNGARRFGLRPVDASGLGVARKTAIGIPWRVALKMIQEGWTLRSPIVWQRKGTIPEPTAHDRPWRTYEMIFMFSKSPRYHFCRKGLGGVEDIWTISARPKHSRGLHYAAFPEELVTKCLDIGCPADGHVLDPFAGSGTVLRVAVQTGRMAVGIDICERFCQFTAKTLKSL